MPKSFWIIVACKCKGCYFYKVRRGRFINNRDDLGIICGASITPRAQRSETPQTHQEKAPGARWKPGCSTLFGLSRPGPVSWREGGRQGAGNAVPQISHSDNLCHGGGHQHQASLAPPQILITLCGMTNTIRSQFDSALVELESHVWARGFRPPP